MDAVLFYFPVYPLLPYFSSHSLRDQNDSVPRYVNDNALLGLENCRAFIIFASSGFSSICFSVFGTHINLTYMT